LTCQKASAGTDKQIALDFEIFFPQPVVNQEWCRADWPLPTLSVYIGRDASGGSAFGILRQSIIERQPCLLARSPDVFSGLKIFWHIQAAARQANDTGARPFGEQ
jgi:hypothetical protein